MIKYPKTFGYKNKFRNMEDVYKEYRRKISYGDEYKSHDSKISYGGFQREFQKTGYLSEQQPASELKSIEQDKVKQETKTEIQNDIQPELKTQNIEVSDQKQSEMKLEQKKELEKQDDVFYNDSLTKYENDIERQPDARLHKRPSPLDRTELRW